MKRLLPGLLFLIMLPSQAQNFFAWQYNDRYYSVLVGSGLTPFFGELNEKKTLRQQFSHVSLGLEARLLSRLSARAEVTYYTLFGDDRFASDSSFSRQRNLSFFSKNVEASLQGIMFLRPYRGDYHKRWTVDPYMGLGVAVTTYNPTAKLDSITYKLRDIETEGVSYGKFAFVLPLTFGLKLRFNEFVNLNVELSYRYTFTDYLDDASNTFIEDDGSIAARLSNRKSEAKIDGEFAVINPVFFDAQVEGAPRGDPGKNDSYMFISFKLEVFIPRGKNIPVLSKPSAY